MIILAHEKKDRILHKTKIEGKSLTYSSIEFFLPLKIFCRLLLRPHFTSLAWQKNEQKHTKTSCCPGVPSLPIIIIPSKCFVLAKL